MADKCGHCRRRKRSYGMTVEAADGSKLFACHCGKTWVTPVRARPPADDRPAEKGCG